MKRIFLVSVLLTMSVMSIFAADFRKGTWGDSKDVVVKAEGIASIVSDKDSYVFESNIGGKECIAGYAFMDGKLFRGVYIFAPDYYDGKEYIRDYDYLKDLLKMKYGEPDRDEKIWASELWKNNPDNYGIAVKTGDVSYITVWNTERTTVCIVMETVESEVQIKIFYESVEQSEDHKAKVLEDL